ncbi:MAG: PqqD family protein [Bacteroidales bacterium]
MKIKSGFELRTIAGENLIVASGVENIDFSKMISMNETATFLWREIEAKGGVFTLAEMAEMLNAEYEVSLDVAMADLKKLADAWIAVGVVEE